LPVIAYEAPGALGCDQPISILRRSDSRSGWEYAEAEGRAVAIQRLAGYDCQQASMPFLDQSNINLAYTYSEQPLVYESQGSAVARCLASASLIRPAPFDPALEFVGIGIEIEAPEMFRVTLPDGKMALVAPGETTPHYATVNGLDVEGPHIRCVQVTKDLNEISGLGVINLAGIAAFDGPATFDLRHFPNGVVHLTTDTGVTLNNQWLGGKPHSIEGSTLDHQWLDVTAECPAGSIPTRLVREWSERNQRTLVEFRISL